MRKAFAIISAFVFALALTSCAVAFNGSRTGNESRLIMEYSVFNTTESQLLALEAGDRIVADIVTDAGKLSVTIQKDNDEPVYENEDVSTSKFDVAIEESGTYKLTVTGDNAKGSVSFKRR